LIVTEINGPFSVKINLESFTNVVSFSRRSIVALGPLIADASYSAVSEDLVLCNVASSVPSLPRIRLCNKQAAETNLSTFSCETCSWDFKHLHFETRMPNAHSTVPCAWRMPIAIHFSFATNWCIICCARAHEIIFQRTTLITKYDIRKLSSGPEYLFRMWKRESS